jgi:hypothetical protein
MIPDKDVLEDRCLHRVIHCRRESKTGRPLKLIGGRERPTRGFVVCRAVAAADSFTATTTANA